MQKQAALTDLQGLIERITYFDEESGYTIAKVKIYGNKDLVTCVGNLINPTPGEIIKMKGEWTNHPKFGQQFKIVFCQTTTPASVYGIQKYLGSGLIKGIGPVMAKRIVSMFGKDTLDIIEQGFLPELETQTSKDKLSDFYFIHQEEPGKAARITAVSSAHPIPGFETLFTSSKGMFSIFHCA